MKIILVVLVIIITALIVVFYIKTPNKNYDVQNTVVEIPSSDGQHKLYIKKKVWGLTSDGQVIVVSGSPKKEIASDSSREYIYNGVVSLFYKYNTDTLTVYVSKSSSVPNNLKSPIVIKQVELENPDMMKLIGNDYYKEQGLKKIE